MRNTPKVLWWSTVMTFTDTLKRTLKTKIKMATVVIGPPSHLLLPMLWKPYKIWWTTCINPKTCKPCTRLRKVLMTQLIWVIPCFIFKCKSGSLILYTTLFIVLSAEKIHRKIYSNFYAKSTEKMLLMIKFSNYIKIWQIIMKSQKRISKETSE